MKKTWICCLMFLIFCICSFTGVSLGNEDESIEYLLQSEGLHIEQVYVNKPEITVYYTGMDNLSKTQCYLGDELLTWERQEKCLGIEYYIALDVSGSIPDTYFEQIKEALTAFCKECKETEHVYFYTFGESVKCLFQGNESVDRQVEIISQLNNRDQETLLFECLVQMAEAADRNNTENGIRRVAVVITDGEDVALGKATTTEAVTKLNQVGIPVYGLGIRDTDEENINSFGEFVRETGGELFVFQINEALETIMKLQKTLRTMQADVFCATSNLVSYGTENLMLVYPDTGEKFYRQIMVSRWIEDTEAPVIERLEKASVNQIKISFSERLSGADKTSAYQVMCNEKPISVIGISYEDGDKPSVILTMSESLMTGTYEVSCSGIYDLSMEKNPLAGSVSGKIEGEETSTINSVEKSKRSVLIWILSGSAVLVIITGVFLAILVKSREKKTVVLDGKKISSANLEIKQHVKLQNLKRKKIMLSFPARGDKKNRTLNMEIEGSLIAGRSDICGLYFDDPKMSKQHFSLETDGESVWITDLESLNGTFLNGVRVTGKRMISNGDEIIAGSVRMQIEW